MRSAVFSQLAHLPRRCAATLVVMVMGSLVAAPIHAVPSSLRSEEDVVDLAEAFLESMVASDVKGAYRLAALYWPLPASELATRIEEAEERRRELRKTLGLSLGHELRARESAGERVVRVTHLERFDKGAVVWRFVFYRADRAWSLVDVTDTSDLSVLFDGP
jgi:hypothetical protein